MFEHHTVISSLDQKCEPHASLNEKGDNQYLKDSWLSAQQNLLNTRQTNSKPTVIYITVNKVVCLSVSNYIKNAPRAQCVICHAVKIDILAAELIYGCSHLIVQFLIKLTLLGFVPAPESTETIRERQMDRHRYTQVDWNRCWKTRSGHAGPVKLCLEATWLMPF